jgi:hypothetical protein
MKIRLKKLIYNLKKDKEMANVKRFEDFVKESTENRRKGVDGKSDLFPKPPLKQTINKSDLEPIDNIGIMGRQITTDKIDGIVKSVVGNDVYVEDRLSKEIKKYTITEFLKEFHKSYKKEKKVEENINIVEVAQPKLSNTDMELLNKIINVNESVKETWEKKWDSFAINSIKSINEDDIIDDIDNMVNESLETIKNDEINEDEINEDEDEINEDEDEINEDEINEDENIEIPEKVQSYADFFKNGIQSFPDFFKNRIKLKPLTTDEDDFVSENAVPKPVKKVICSDCGVEVSDIENDKINHLYSKHSFKPTMDDGDLEKWLLEYFPPEIPEKKK